MLLEQMFDDNRFLLELEEFTGFSTKADGGLSLAG